MFDLPDPPYIRNAERTGYEDGREDRPVICPVCGEQDPDFIYVYKSDNMILGCTECIERKVPEEVGEI